MLSAPAIVRGRLAVAVCGLALESVTLTATVKLPAVVGVPVI
jgi:hypothetical protein